MGHIYRLQPQDTANDTEQGGTGDKEPQKMMMCLYDDDRLMRWHTLEPMDDDDDVDDDNGDYNGSGSSPLAWLHYMGRTISTLSASRYRITRRHDDEMYSGATASHTSMHDVNADRNTVFLRR